MQNEGSGYNCCAVYNDNFIDIYLLLFYTASDRIESEAIQNCWKSLPLHIVTLCERNVWTIDVKPTGVRNNFVSNNLTLYNNIIQQNIL